MNQMTDFFQIAALSFLVNSLFRVPSSVLYLAVTSYFFRPVTVQALMTDGSEESWKLLCKKPLNKA